MLRAHPPHRHALLSLLVDVSIGWGRGESTGRPVSLLTTCTFSLHVYRIPCRGNFFPSRFLCGCGSFRVLCESILARCSTVLYRRAGVSCRQLTLLHLSTVPYCPLLPLTVPYCPFLPLTAPYCPLLSLSDPYCPLLPLSVPYCPLLPLSVPYCPLMPLSVPYCPLLPLLPARPSCRLFGLAVNGHPRRTGRPRPLPSLQPRHPLLGSLVHARTCETGWLRRLRSTLPTH